VRWLRPEFQNPAGTKAATQTSIAGAEDEATEEPEAAAAVAWPKKMADQAALVRDLVARSAGEWTATQGAKAFKGAKPKEVEDVLGALAAVGVLAGYGDGKGRRWRSVA
jgi:heme oxygenase